MSVLETIGHALFVLMKVLLVAVSLATVALTLYEERRRLGFTWLVWRRFTILAFVEVCLVLITTIFTYFVLQSYLPVLTWGWMSLFVKNGGNVIIAPIFEGQRSSWIAVRLLVPVFFVAMLAIVPAMAKREEDWFRKGHHTWRTIWRQSLKFGFIHCIVGVPLGIGLVLSGVGLFYAWKYHSTYLRCMSTMSGEQAEEEALLTSTMYHSLYNTVVVVVVIVATTIMAFAS